MACLVPVGYLTVKAPHSARPAAVVMAAQMDQTDSVVFIDEVYYDLSFYLNLKQPPIVASDWASPDIPQRDNWRKELHDAARFDPARAQKLLWPIARVGELVCQGHAVWFVLHPRNEQLIAGIAGLQPIYADREIKLMRASARPC
jgi:hypothetical protein